MMTATETECSCCGELLEGEELDSPYHDDDGPLCDDCYHEHYEFYCCLCQECGHVDDQHNMLVVCEPVHCDGTYGSRRPTLDAGLYRVKRWPYWATNYFSMWFYSDCLDRVGEVPNDVDTHGYECGHLCLNCQREVMAQIAAKWAGDGI